MGPGNIQAYPVESEWYSISPPAELTSGVFQGTKVSDTEEFCDSFVGTSPFPPGVVPKKLGVVRYKGELEHPQWVDLEPGQCDISAVTGRSLIRDGFEQTTMRPCVMS
jgi:hypothetical protein